MSLGGSQRATAPDDGLAIHIMGLLFYYSDLAPRPSASTNSPTRSSARASERARDALLTADYFARYALSRFCSSRACVFAQRRRRKYDGRARKIVPRRALRSLRKRAAAALQLLRQFLMRSLVPLRRGKNFSPPSFATFGVEKSRALQVTVTCSFGNTRNVVRYVACRCLLPN